MRHPGRILKAPANQYVTDFIGANRLWANPEYIRARDIMRRRPITISRGRTVLQALQIMRQSGVDSLLVVDGRDRLLGGPLAGGADVGERRLWLRRDLPLR